MKIVQWTLAVVGAIALALVVGGFFVPSRYQVERDTLIAAPPAKVFDYLVEPRKWTLWSAWSRRDPRMRIVYGGPPFGMGARWSWESASQGDGSMEFIAIDPDRRIDYALVMPAFNMRSIGSLRLAPEGAGTRVTWSMEGDVGPNPLKHYLAAAMDRMVGPDFQEGLANLKAVAEKR
jgi:uncharacterized protein YndB with AHSA1/START domain